MDAETIQQAAIEVRQRYNPEGLVPFPFEELAEKLKDVEIVRLSTKEFVSGVIFCSNDIFTIVVNEDKPATRQYFTIAHEFGHYFLHGDWLKKHTESGFVDYAFSLDTSNMLLRPDNVAESDVDPVKEREANNFAAELIMPADKVAEYWELTGNIEECADAFQVSTAAMAMRLDRLGLA